VVSSTVGSQAELATADRAVLPLLATLSAKG